ncbi:MAG: decaprenyl-phosphate phosphoribosyltransferase [Gammaproteobacteria bacterium]|nr:decaprenyl-phosphate phosphoribosyltransferase [Gammaproteobacteria bacterium]
MGKAVSLVQLMRPQQWVKNLFVFAGLLFNQSFGDIPLVGSVLLAFAAFCLVASSIYVINDICDREQDQIHEKKKLRPIASGAVSIKAGWSLAAVLLVVGLMTGYFASPNVMLMLGIYVVLNIGYSFGLKRIVILDVFIIAAGFLLRILAGTIGVGMEPSEWLFLCSLCLTLFLGFGKRRAELLGRGNAPVEDGQGRTVLQEYSPVLLDSMMAAVAACTFVTYGLFTMSDETAAQHGTRALVYTLPLVMYAMFRYFYMLHVRGKGNDPSEDLVRDPHVIIAGTLWLIATYLIIR